MFDPQILPTPDQVQRHLVDIRQSDRRVRLVMICKLTVPMRASPCVLCARSEGCLLCQQVLDELRVAGFRVADVGILSPIEMEGIGLRETPAPPAAK